MGRERAAVSSRTASAAPGTSAGAGGCQESGGAGGAGLGRLEAAASCWESELCPVFIGSLGTLETETCGDWGRGWGAVFFITALVSCCGGRKPAKLWVTTKAQRICRNGRVAYLMGKWFPQ